MSYQRERDEVIARLTREGLDINAITTLLRCATTINRLSELACSSEAADRDRIRCPRIMGERIAAHAKRGAAIKAFEKYPCLCDYDSAKGQHTTIPRITLQDWQAEQRAIKAVPAGWLVLTSGDPRGYTLRVVPLAWAERNAGKDRHNLDSIGIPPGPSHLRF